MLSLKSVKCHPVLSDLKQGVADHFTDACIVGSDTIQVPVQRVVLGACMSMLSSALGEIPCYVGVAIHVPDTEEETIRHFLQLVTFGEVDCEYESSYTSLLELMQVLGVDYMSKCHTVCVLSEDICNSPPPPSDEDELPISPEPFQEQVNYQPHSIKIETGSSESDTKHWHKPGHHFAPSEDVSQDSFISSVVDNSSPDHPDLVLQCHQCSKCFSTGEHLEKHVTRYHSEGGMFKCSLCEFSGKSKHSLKSHHTIIHDRAKNFQCAVCQRTFSTKSDMKRHTDTVHLKVKRFACQYCSHTFFQKADLNRHSRLHTGEKPFCCSICMKSFSQSTSLKYHEASHQLQ